MKTRAIVMEKENLKWVDVGVGGGRGEGDFLAGFLLALLQPYANFHQVFSPHVIQSRVSDLFKSSHNKIVFSLLLNREAD